MSTKLPGRNPTAYLGIKETNPPQLYFKDVPPTTSDAAPYDQGDIWIDQTGLEAYILAEKVGGLATWLEISGGGTIETLTGDSGGAVSPNAALNINLLGNADGMEITGVPASNELNFKNLRNITDFVVDPTAGETEYQTIQSAINAANAAGGGTVWIRPGTYVEDLTLYDAVDLISTLATPAAGNTLISGTHTPPTTGAISFRNLSLQDTTNILNSAAAGSTTITFIDCLFTITNGYSINLTNWTGLIVVLNCHSQGTQDGFIDIGAGTANFFCNGSTIGAGTNNIAALGGINRITNTNVDCRMDWVVNSSGHIRGCQLADTWLISDSASGTCTDTIFDINGNVAINQTSSAKVILSNVTINSSAAPDVIIGTGEIEFASVNFIDGNSINAGITKQDFTMVETSKIHIGNETTDTTYYLDVVEDTSDEVRGRFENTETADIDANAALYLKTGGAGGGDPYVKMSVEGGRRYTLGIDNSDSDLLKWTRGATPSDGNILWQMTDVGERTLPFQPAFLALNSANRLNVTGAGAVVNPVIFDSEIFDQNADYNNGTYIFTAPVTGRYFFTCTILLDNLTVAMTVVDFDLITSNRTYRSFKSHPGNTMDANNDLRIVGTFFVDMDAADTAQISLTIFNGVGNTAAIGGNAGTAVTYFAGQLSV